MSLRTCIVTPLVPKYRVPVFERLAAEPGIDLEVWADTSGRVGSLPGLTTSERFKLRSAPYHEGRGFIWQPGMAKAVRAGFDVVILHWNVRSPHLALALTGRRPAVALWGHGFGREHARVGDWLRRLAADRADACILYGPSGRDRVVAAGVDPSKVFVAPNAVDQDPIQQARAAWASRESRRKVMHDAGVGDDPFLLFLGRTEQPKLPSLAVDALAALRRVHPRLRLVFLGDGSARNDLESRSERLGVRDAVHFLGAVYEERAIAPWAMEAEFLIHPGALGLSIFHGFGYGLPIVTSDAMPIHPPEVEALEPGVNGLLYRHGNVDDLVDCCRRLLEDRQERDRLRENALRTVLAEDGRNVASMVRGLVTAIRAAHARHGGDA